jgi:plastocyanin
MRRQLPLIFCLLLVAAGAAFAGVANAGASTPSKPAATPVARVSIKIVSGTACKPAAEFCFKPTLKSVVPGTKVTWVNKTLTVHTVTRCTSAACGGVSGGTGKDTGLGSGTIAKGAKYSFVFHGAGTYTYYCQIHGYALMHGTITVT